MGLLDSLHIDPQKFRSWVRNVASSYLDVAIGGATFFFLTPFIVHQLGLASYSIWLVCHTITFYLRFFDLGFGQAQVRYQAKFHAQGRTELGRRLISTSGSALFVAGTLSLIAGFALAKGVQVPGIDIPVRLEMDYHRVMFILAAGLFLSIPGSALSNVYYGTQRFDLANARSIFLQLLGATLQFTALNLGYGIVVLAAIEFSMSALRLLIDFIVIRRLYPEFFHKLRFGFDPAIWKRVRRFAVWSSLDDLLVEGTSQLDRVFIVIFLPLAQLAPYALCKSVGGIVSMIIEPMTQTFYPMAAGLYAKGKRQSLHHLLLAGTKTATAIALPIALFLALFGDDGLTLWVPDLGKHAIPHMLITFIAINLLLSVFLWTSTIMLLASNHVRAVAFITIGEVLLAFACIGVLTRYFGLTGIAMGSLIANFTIGVTVQIPLLCRVMKISPRAFLLPTFGRVAFAALPVLALASWLHHAFTPESWIELGALAAIIFVTFAASFVVLGISATERQQYLGIVKGYLRGDEEPVAAVVSETPLR
jgi:O-antigen/teichoic acid export membrane protein